MKRKNVRAKICTIVLHDWKRALYQLSYQPLTGLNILYTSTTIQDWAHLPGWQGRVHLWFPHSKIFWHSSSQENPSFATSSGETSPQTTSRLIFLSQKQVWVWITSQSSQGPSWQTLLQVCLPQYNFFAQISLQLTFAPHLIFFFVRPQEHFLKKGFRWNYCSAGQTT